VANGAKKSVWGRWATYGVATAIAVAALWAALRPNPVDIEVAQVRRGPLQVTVTQQGEVRVQDRYVVTVPVAGRIARVTLKDGDPIARGQVVAQLQPAPLDARERDQAQAKLEAARALVREAQQNIAHVQAELAQAERERVRAEKLLAEKFVSSEAVERARTAEATARSSFDAARARESAARFEARATEATLLAADGKPGRLVPLVSPSDGHVLRVMEQSERTLAAGAPVMVIGDASKIEIVADLLSTDAVKVPPGAAVLIENWGGDRTLRGRVRTVEPYAFTKVSALGVEEKRVNVVVDLLDPPGPLGDGYRVEARVVLWSAENVLKVPANAVFRSSDGWAVFVAEGGRAERRAIEVGQRNALEAEIVAGLKEGDTVIQYPGNQIADGARIAIR
jgi:HlyD family secretion protein